MFDSMTRFSQDRDSVTSHLSPELASEFPTEFHTQDLSLDATSESVLKRRPVRALFSALGLMGLGAGLAIIGSIVTRGSVGWGSLSPLPAVTVPSRSSSSTAVLPTDYNFVAEVVAEVGPEVVRIEASSAPVDPLEEGPDCLGASSETPPVARSGVGAGFVLGRTGERRTEA